jgi:hypothetical protein
MVETTSLELSKKLKEAGFPQETDFYWIQETDADFQLYYACPQEDFYLSLGEGALYNLEIVEIYAAPTGQEIGMLLMSNIDEFIRNTLPTLNSELFYEWYTTDHPYYNPNLLAKVWLYLREIGLL